MQTYSFSSSANVACLDQKAQVRGAIMNSSAERISLCMCATFRLKPSPAYARAYRVFLLYPSPLIRLSVDLNT